MMSDHLVVSAFGKDYLKTDPHYMALVAMDDALKFAQYETYGVILQAICTLVASEAVFQGLHGPYGKLESDSQVKPTLTGR
jgi:hypothetical protein